MRILIAEDQPSIRVVLERIVSRLGYDVATVEDGRAAVEAAAGGDFAVVFMDCEMPKLDGYGATRELRERGVSVPIVAMTAHVAGSQRTKALDAGMNDFLTKPASREEIAAMILKWSVIDEGRYAELLTAFGPDGAAELVTAWLDGTPAQIADIVQTRDAAVLDGLARSAHKLRGGSLMVGAAELERVAGVVERAARDGVIAPEAALIESVWDATASALRARCQPG